MNLYGRHFVAALGIYPVYVLHTRPQDRHSRIDKDPQRSSVSNESNTENGIKYDIINRFVEGFARKTSEKFWNVKDEEEQCLPEPGKVHFFRSNGSLCIHPLGNLLENIMSFCSGDLVSERDVQEAVDQIWITSIKGKMGTGDAPVPKPIVEFFGSTFRVSFSIPCDFDTRQVVVEMKKFLRKQQMGTDEFQAFSEEQTSGPRGTAIVVRARSQLGGSVSLHIFEEKASDSSDNGFCRIEYEASLNEENLKLLSVSMDGLHRQKYKDLHSWLGDEDGPIRDWNNAIDTGKYWSSLQEIMKALEHGNEIEDGDYGSGWLADLHKFLEKGLDYEESRRMKMNESVLIRRLKLLGCTIVMPEEDMKDSANQVDFAGVWPGFAGYEDQKKIIAEDIILPIQHPEVYKKLRSKTRGKLERTAEKVALFSGPPGTGKSSAAQAIASLVKLPLVRIHVDNHSTSSLWHLEREHKLIRAIHACNDMKNGAIVLISLPESSVSLLPLVLQAMDPVSEKTQYIISTDSIDSVNISCLNSFSTRIAFMLPSEKDREDIFRHYARHLSIKDAQNLATLSKGLSGSDIKSICDRSEHQWAANICKEGSTDLAGAPGLEVYESVLSQWNTTDS